MDAAVSDPTGGAAIHRGQSTSGREAPLGNGRLSPWRYLAVSALLPAALTVALAVAVVAWIALPALRDNLMEARRQTLAELTASAHNLLEQYRQRVESGELTLEEAQRRALERLKVMRYGQAGKDYFWVNDLEPRMLMHPYLNDLVGRNVSDVADRAGKPIFAEFAREAREDGGGYVVYRWQYMDNPDRVEEKLSHVRLFRPWGWVIGTGMYVDDVREQIAAVTRRVLWVAVPALAGIGLLSGYMIWQAARVQKRRLAAEGALVQSESTLRAIFDNAFQLIGLLDTRGTILKANLAAEKFVHDEAGDLTGIPFWEGSWWGCETERDQVRHDIARAAEGAFIRREVIHRDRLGRDHIIDLSLKPVRDSAGQVTLIVAEGRDITDLKEAQSQREALQNQLRHAQKMEALGQLAGGVAHDFNNLLTGILGSAEMLADALPATSPQHALAREITTVSLRAAELTRGLLAFSRKGPIRRVVVDLHGLVDETLDLLGRSIDRRIEIVRRLEAGLPTVLADPAQLQNAILNLCVNARDAMPGGGVLTVATRNVQVGEDARPDGLPAGLAPGSHIELSLTDTGVGMTPEVQQRVFEPFFTTKPTGEGTGLGLAAVYGCLQNHGGAIDLQSQPGQGTTVRLWLATTTASMQEPATADAGDLRGHGHVLVVDDEATVRRFVSAALQKLGYEVSQAGDGAEAVALLTQHGGGIDLVLLDLVMPRMDGEETFRRLREIRPEVPIILSSGFSHSDVTDRLLRQGAVRVLHKPFRVQELAQAVAEAIGRSPV